MIGIERLRVIDELDLTPLPGGGEVPDEYVSKLTSFTDEVAAKGETLRDAVADFAVSEAAACINDISGMLQDIGAGKLAAECKEKAAAIADMTAGSLEAYTESFLAAVSSLSIDILMALHSDGEAGGTSAQTAQNAEGEISILAVDDNAFFLNTIKSYLKDSPYKLTCVTSGSVALRFLEKHSPNLMIFDIDMPEMDGYELAGKVREAGITAPIIFLTGNASKDYVIRAVKVGAVDFIIKPLSREKALSKISKHIKHI